MSDAVRWGATYWPSEAGPHMWERFDPEVVRADFAAMARHHVQVARVPVSWGAFVPRPGARNGAALAALETVLTVAAAAGVRTVLLVGPQSIGDTVSLPAFAVDHSGRGSTRVLVGGRQEPGSPRDIYAEAGMLEAQMEWLELLLSCFGSHPAIAAWDLGHDPASTIRPRHISDIASWTELLAGRLHAAGEQVWLTLGPGDFIRARGVRPGLLAAHVDVLGLAVMPQRLRIASAFPDESDVLFLLHLARQLIGESPLAVMLSLGAGDVPSAPVSLRDPGITRDAQAAEYVDRLLPQVVESGAVSLLNHPSHNPGEAVALAAPLDRISGLRQAGWFDRNNDLTALGRIWSRYSGREMLRQRVNRDPGLDAEAYFAGLPDSLLDLNAQWRSGRSADPDILV